MRSEESPDVEEASQAASSRTGATKRMIFLFMRPIYLRKEEQLKENLHFTYLFAYLAKSSCRMLQW